MLFTQENAHPISLYIEANKLLESDISHWDASSIMIEIDNKISPNLITRKNLNKLLAVKTAYTLDSPWLHWEVFLSVSQALNNQNISPEILLISDDPIPHLFLTIDILNKIRQEEFNKEIKTFLAAVFLHENVHYAPSPLDFIQADISQPYYKCKICGSSGSALPPFIGTCLECAKVHNLEETQKPFNFKPPIEEELHNNIEIKLSYTFQDEKKRYEEIERKLGNNEEVHLEENQIDTQMMKLIRAKDYVDYQNKLLHEQLKTIQARSI